MSKGVYIFQGGTDLMISMMKDELMKNGVDIQLQAKVDKILIENKKVIGVQIKEHKIFASAVVSNSNLKVTIEQMVGPEYFSPEFITKARAVRLNTSSCQVYMGIKKGETIPFIGDLIFTSEDPKFSTDLILSPKVGSQTFSVYYPEMRPHLPPQYAIVSSSNARFSDWSTLSDEEYEIRKKFLIERAIQGLEKILPDIRSKIDFVEAATPRTFKRYTLHAEGSSFGTKFEGLEISMNLHHEIEGLFHAGSVGIIMSGWLGAANYGVIQAHEIEKLLGRYDSKS
jgi:phytoene dehydrogenase-like protein